MYVVASSFHLNLYLSIIIVGFIKYNCKLLESDLIRQYTDEMNVMLYGSSELSSLMGAVRAAVRYINYIYRDARVVELSSLYQLLSVNGQLLIAMFLRRYDQGF